MEYLPLEESTQLDQIKGAKGINLIFKHNTTCPISRSMRAQFEMDAPSLTDVNAVYFLDLLAHRDISNAIAQQFDVPHESPQLLVIRDGECINSQSLYDISAEKTAEAIAG
jgi:bacillithiol system protein YtxJ